MAMPIENLPPVSGRSSPFRVITVDKIPRKSSISHQAKGHVQPTGVQKTTVKGGCTACAKKK